MRVWFVILLALGLAVAPGRLLAQDAENDTAASETDSASSDSQAPAENAPSPSSSGSETASSADSASSSSSSSTAASRPSDTDLQSRTVYNASNWAAVKGPLAPLWEAWRGQEAAAGRPRNEFGHLTDLDGIKIVNASRPDQVPADAVAAMVSLAEDGEFLVGADAASANALRKDEFERVQSARADLAEEEREALRQADEERRREEEEALQDGEAGEDEDDEDSDVLGTGNDGEDGDENGDGDPDGDSDNDEDGDGDGDEDGDGPSGPDDPGDGSEGDEPGDGPGDDSEDNPDLDDNEIPVDVDPLGDRGNLAYGTSHDRQVLDLYLPPNVTENIPVVVFFHGGGFYRGDKRSVDKFLPIVEAGYALASCNYKLLNKSSQAEVDFLNDVGQIAIAAHDARKAVRFLKDNAATYNLNPNAFATVGGSAGGYLAAIVGASSDVGRIRGESEGSTTSSGVQAVVDISGPTDFATFADLASGLVGAARGVIANKGGVTPYEYASAGDPPHLIRHGEIDPVVPVQQSQIYAAKLQEAGVSVDLKTYPTLAHEPDPGFYDELVAEIITFLDSNLR